MLDTLINGVLGFFEDVFEAISNLVIWINDLAQKISETELSTSGITLILGNFRYLAGDTLYFVFITGFYVGVLMIAFKCIPIVVSWFKHFLPTH